MGELSDDPKGPRPEVVRETFVVVDRKQSTGGAWGLVLAVGIVAAVFGVLVLANIWASVHLVAVFAGLFLLFAGVLQFFIGGAARTGRVVAGVVAVVAGIALIAWPSASVKTVAVIVGLAFLISGVSVLITAVSARGEGYGLVVGLGVIPAFVGLVFIIWPGPTVALLMILVGLSALLFGIAAVVHALVSRRTRR